jgi:hypothetical protein
VYERGPRGGLGCRPEFVFWVVASFGAALSRAEWVSAAEEDIRDIRGPKAVSGSWMLGGAVLAVVVVFVALFAYRRLRRQDGARLGRSLTLSEQALESLERTRPLMSPATAREFGIAASEVIRNYIERRFNVVATQRTTEEFLQGLMQGSNESLARHHPLLEGFLQKCDFVKFAGASLAMADLEAVFQSARRFVLETGEAPAGA